VDVTSRRPASIHHVRDRIDGGLRFDMIHRPLLLACLLALPSCSSSSTGDACPDRFPAKPDGGSTPAGCYAVPPITACEVGSGSTCTSQCNADEQSMGCYAGASMATVPEPDAALGCRVLPLPTPQGQSFHCCPCK
jgi:hypothetical protein